MNGFLKWFPAALGIALAAGVGVQAAEPVDYADHENWLCRPDHPNACAADQTATIVAADGTLTREPFASDPEAPVDCFYVYPTVSLDGTPNSDMEAGPEEMSVISGQFARFGAVCRTFAPLYRQVTLTALRAGLGGQAMEVDRALGYNDVLAAWNHYLANDNDGRGVVLIGHSQGAGVLTRLVAAEIDGKPIQERLISALILGSSGVVTPPESDVGGTFQLVPVCRSEDQTGCVVQFASFRDTVPPPDGSLFGRPREGEGKSVCVNPASISGESGELHAYLRNDPDNHPWVADEVIDTPFVSVPGLLSAECVYERGFSYLSVTVHGDPDDPRADDITGDVITNGEINPGWGLHLVDVHLAMGNLVDLVRAQAAAYLAR
jgi:pimeloyl-ACP methyl ester carboxylesterase